MEQIKTAVQLYSVRRELKEAPLGTLKRIADMGYQGVEFFGAPQYGADEINAWLKETGLEICGWHTPIDGLRGDEFDRTVAFNKAIGNTRLIVPALPREMTRSLDDWRDAARQISAICEKLAGHGMKTGYHNHAAEFIKIDGVRPWDAFFGEASPGVLMQLDTGNAMSAGADVDVAEVLRAYPGRSDSVHLKPFLRGTADGFATMMGEDSQPYEEILELCKMDITRWFIVEYEHDTYCEPMKAVDQCIRALCRLGF